MQALLIAVLALATASLAQSWSSPHQVELERHRHHPVLDLLIGDGGQPSIPLLPRARPAGQRGVVFGYLPYWIDGEYYQKLDFEVLTHVSAFSVEINADGTIAEDHGWPWTALVDSAHAHGVRVMLTATLFGDGQVLSLVADDEYRDTFRREIRDLILEGNADGLNVDFEGPSANGWASLINEFMAELTTYLHREIPGCEVSFAAPAVDWGGRWDFAGLANSCDYLFIMGYAFTGSWSEASGPTAPLTGGWRNITTTVTGASDYGEVSDSHPEKLILGVPYYGCQWETVGPEAGAAIRGFVRYPYLKEALTRAAAYGRRWDATSQTAWTRYQSAGKWYQVWYDDPTALSLKYDLALRENLRGVGMWALGYEGDRREPWELLALKMGRRTPATAVEDEPTPKRGALGQNYPNPFNGATRIAYDLDAAGRVDLAVFDALGRLVRRGRRQQEGPGAHAWHWDGRDDQGEPVGSGVYVYRMVFTGADDVTWAQSRRMVLVR